MASKLELCPFCGAEWNRRAESPRPPDVEPIMVGSAGPDAFSYGPASPSRPPDVARLLEAAREAVRAWKHEGDEPGMLRDSLEDLEDALAPFERLATGDSGKASGMD